MKFLTIYDIMEKEQSLKKEQNNSTDEVSSSEAKTEIEDNNHDQKKENKNTPEEKINELEDKLARSLAEMENQRRRYEKEKEDAFDYGGFAFAKEALNLIDNLERSQKSLEADETLKNSDALKKISEHLEIIYKDTISIFKKNNIEPIKSINQKLDPNLHQAMLEIEDDSKDTGTIVQEIQKGFLMKDRLLRPSLVAVSKKTAKIEGKEEHDDKKNTENNEKMKKK